MKKNLYIVALFLIGLTACNDDNGQNTPTNETTTVTLNFDNRISENTDLDLGSSFFVTQNGETVTTNMLKYIISNIQLTRADGSVFTYPKEDSYFVINEQDATSLQITLTDVPVGAYTHISYGIGVDASEYPIESGALNFIPRADDEGMIWNWAAGYIFIKFEGTYMPENGTLSDPFVIHVGSHGDNLDNYKTVTLPFQNTVNATTSETTEINITAIISEILDAGFQMRLEDASDIQVDPVNAPKIAENFQRIFTVD